MAARQAEYANAIAYHHGADPTNRAIAALAEARQHIDVITILEKLERTSDKDLAIASFSPYPSSEPLTD